MVPTLIAERTYIDDHVCWEINRNALVCWTAPTAMNMYVGKPTAIPNRNPLKMPQRASKAAGLTPLSYLHVLWAASANLRVIKVVQSCFT